MVLVALVVPVSGCGAGEGVEEGAVVSVYAAAPLCSEAKRELVRHGQKTESVTVRVACLPATDERGGVDLAGIGANARKATEDSTTVAYIGETSPRATRFSQTILDAAGVAQVSGMGGDAALDRIFGAIEAAGDAGNLREVVFEEIGGGA